MINRTTCIMFVVLFASALHAAPNPTLDELLDLAPPGGDQAAPARDDQVMPPSQAGDPTTAVLEDMRSVSDRLGRDLDPGLQTQRMQEAIMARLDQLIKQAKQQQQQSSSSSSSSSSSQQQQQQEQGSQSNAQQKNQNKSAKAEGDSDTAGQGENKGETGSADKVDRDLNEPLRQNRVEWGNLPPRVRDELLQGSHERFSPIYRELTEAYYRRLSEESK